jgi:glyoxylase-like metal-dependent hydrolase (beta-lactamase superfamily II)
LCCHTKEAPSVAKACPVDIYFTESVTRLVGIEVIHTPGHSDGSVSFLYQSPSGRSYLFTGDTLFQSNGRWCTFVLSGIECGFRNRGKNGSMTECGGFLTDEAPQCRLV